MNSSPSDIPGARILLRQAMGELRRLATPPPEASRALALLAAMEPKMTRARPVMKSRAKSRQMTPELAGEIKAYRRANPGLSQEDISWHFKIKQGRVSEALNGHWDEGGAKWQHYMRRMGKADDCA